jgi:hypothetical protein
MVVILTGMVILTAVVILTVLTVFHHSVKLTISWIIVFISFSNKHKLPTNVLTQGQ